MRVSIVIPVYNEEHHLRACLEAVGKQLQPFHEVIVVDNNSSDNSAAIAKAFPFVTLITEQKQGAVYARTAGFDAATGDIIARIDGDTIITPDWSGVVADIFADAAVDAVSGSPLYYDVAFPRLANRVDLLLRRRLAWDLREVLFLYGANMAIRRSAWCQVRDFCCMRNAMHEDFDLAIHLQDRGHFVVFDERLVAGVSARRVDVSFWRFARYVRMSPHTYALHDVPNRRNMYPVIALTYLFHPVARVLHRGYNPQTGEFSVRRVFASQPTAGRVDPMLHTEA